MKYILVFICLIGISCHPQSKKQTRNETRVKENVLTKKNIEQTIAAEDRIKINSVGILVYDGFFDLDAIGPYSVLSNMIGTNVFFVSEKKGIVRASSGIEISVTNSINEIKSLDVLVIPGGLSQWKHADGQNYEKRFTL